MAGRYEQPFAQIDSTAPGFEAAFDTTGVTFAIQATKREFKFAHSRGLQIVSAGAAEFWMVTGKASVTASTATSMMVPGGARTVYSVPDPTHSHIAFVATTSVIASITLGYGQ